MMRLQVGMNPLGFFFTWVLEIRIQVLIQQALYQLGHLPRPKTTNFSAQCLQLQGPSWNPLTLIGWGRLFG